MELGQVPAALQACLGAEATVGLVQLLDRCHHEAKEDLISAGTERFERRLVDALTRNPLQPNGILRL